MKEERRFTQRPVFLSSFTQRGLLLSFLFLVGICMKVWLSFSRFSLKLLMDSPSPCVASFLFDDRLLYTRGEMKTEPQSSVVY